MFILEISLICTQNASNKLQALFEGNEFDLKLMSFIIIIFIDTYSYIWNSVYEYMMKKKIHIILCVEW